MTFQDFIYKYQKEEVKEFPNKVIELDALVTVCVYTYNHVKYIKQCLDGILRQKTRFHYEIYLGEDESTDGTREICLEYAQRYPDKIRLILHSRKNNIIINGNPSGRFNSLYAYLTARGKYIAICEGDDYWTDENKLQKQVDFLEANINYSLCYHAVNILNETGRKPDPNPFNPAVQNATTRDVIKGHFIPTPSMVFKKSCFDIDFFSDNSSEIRSGDIFIELLLSLKGNFYYHSEAMAVYRAWNGSVSARGRHDFSWVESSFKLYSLFNNYSNRKFEKEIAEKIISMLKLEREYIVEREKGEIKRKRLKQNRIYSFKYLPFRNAALYCLSTFSSNK